MQKLLYLLNTLPKLGVFNVLYIFWYRFSFQSGLRKKKFPAKESWEGTFFYPKKNNAETLTLYKDAIIAKADAILKGTFTYYHYHQFNLKSIPNWFYDPFSQKQLNPETTKKHWTEIDEFDLNTGDIKNLWEISRFDWLTDLGRAYAVTGNEKYLNQINLLLNDWSLYNPVNVGINWKCGQETSIRVMKLFYAAMLFGQLKTISGVLFDWVFSHLERIDGNIRYAVAQDNNHGTSESAGLYIGACWLLSQHVVADRGTAKQLKRFKKRGRRILENRLRKLILEDGTFSQKSVNYHRVVVDTISFVLFGIKEFNEPEFNSDILRKLEALGNWLFQMISNEKGEVSVLGANDGAMFETLHSCDYRDYRPSVQLYFALLHGIRVWDVPALDEVLWCRGIDPTRLKGNKKLTLETKVFDKEFVQIVWKDIVVRVIATRNNFRPGNDVLHVDLWYQGENILFDTGSYSYNAKESSFFKTITAHNTLQFGSFEPMPRLSRFLNGKWVNVKSFGIVETAEKAEWSGEYVDYRKNYHKRTIGIKKESNAVYIKDDFMTVKKNEVKTIRFHMNEAILKKCRITSFDQEGSELHPLKRDTWQSLYYMQREKIKCFEFYQEAKQGQFTTIIKFV